MSSEEPRATAPTVQALGEQEILRRLHQFCPSHLIGDDAAWLAPPANHELVVTTDMLVQEVHFSDRTMSPKDVGWRCAAVNFSDLAAMGARPLGLTLGLGLPPDLPWPALADLYAGVTECLTQYGGVILGGDITRSQTLTIGVTALGTVQPDQKILRSAAQAGQVLVTTGWHGAARAGLEKLLYPEWGRDLSPQDRAEIVRYHRRPMPRLDVIDLLQGNLTQMVTTSDALKSLDLESCTIAGMDSSDGLADAVLQLCRASQVGALLDGNHLPIHPILQKTESLTPEQSLDWTLYGGEDFELILAMDSPVADALLMYLGDGARQIGVITPEPGIDCVFQGQRIPLSFGQTFQHWSTGACQ